MATQSLSWGRTGTANRVLEQTRDSVLRSRIPVATVVGMVAEGMTPDEILRSFPDLEAEDVHASLLYAAEAVRERELPLRHASRSF